MFFLLVLSHISGFYFIVWFSCSLLQYFIKWNEGARRRICFFPPSFDCDFNFFSLRSFVRPLELCGGERRDGFVEIFGVWLYHFQLKIPLKDETLRQKCNVKASWREEKNENENVESRDNKRLHFSRALRLFLLISSRISKRKNNSAEK